MLNYGIIVLLGNFVTLIVVCRLNQVFLNIKYRTLLFKSDAENEKVIDKL